MTTIAFDIYGTLINPYSVGILLKEIVGNQATTFNNLWRDKQLEYSFRQAAMKEFNHFTHCTKMALEYSDQVLKTNISPRDFTRLLNAYRELPAYDQVPEVLKCLKKSGIEIVAFSNGAYDDLIALFKQANILDLFDQVISVDEVGTFKPAPEVYQLLRQKVKSDRENLWLVSTNSFDIIGARAVGLKTAWLRRNPNAHLDPFGYESTLIVDDLNQLKKHFPKHLSD